MSRQIFEQRFPVPADAIWNEQIGAYVWNERIPVKHPHDELWFVWQEAVDYRGTASQEQEQEQ